MLQQVYYFTLQFVFTSEQYITVEFNSFQVSVSPSKEMGDRTKPGKQSLTVDLGGNRTPPLFLRFYRSQPNSGGRQELITRSVQLPHIRVMAFLRTYLFLD